MKTSDTIASVLKRKSTSQVLSIGPHQTVFEALTKMAEHNIGALLVLDGARLAGIFSERDYARRGVLLGNPSRDTLVHELMTSHVESVTPQHTVDHCLTLMTDRHFRHLPVVDNGEVVGLVSIGDLVKWVISGQERKIQELEGYISGSYPA
jgi:CBS domain-containing protein